jgi:hypothetical protein
MNWRFGFSLGKTELDGQIYGAASAAADCFKALVPFFFFAAIRNKMWSQATASAVLWVVVTAYSLTSALGHAALNRLDTTGQRAVDAASYKDLRADLKRAQDQLGWIPQHRPAQTVQAEIDGLKNQKAWGWTKGCTEVASKSNRDYCQKFHALGSELASAEQAGKFEARIADINAKLASVKGTSASAEADPQAAVLTKLAGLIVPGIKVEDMQTALTFFVAVLLEVGSGFGMYVAFATWRLYDEAAPSVRRVNMRQEPETIEDKEEPEVLVPVSKPALAETVVERARVEANDNGSRWQIPVGVPDNDVQRFVKERIVYDKDSDIVSLEVYEDYCRWSEEQGKSALALPSFGREFGKLCDKRKIGGRVRYFGVALKSEMTDTEDKKVPAFRAA